MVGDNIVPRAKGQTTHAITIHAATDGVWPWLVQMGYHRAGWYTYPWVDRYLWHIDNPSAAKIVPELQHLAAGDIVPDGEPGSAFYRVAVLDAPRTLVLHSSSHVPQPLRGRMSVDWTWGLRAARGGRGDHTAGPSRSGVVRAMVGSSDLRRHDRAERFRHGQEHAARHRAPRRGPTFQRRPRGRPATAGREQG
jgi:hypothetical protein